MIVVNNPCYKRNKAAITSATNDHGGTISSVTTRNFFHHPVAGPIIKNGCEVLDHTFFRDEFVTRYDLTPFVEIVTVRIHAISRKRNRNIREVIMPSLRTK